MCAHQITDIGRRKGAKLKGCIDRTDNNEYLQTICHAPQLSQVLYLH